MVSPLAPKGGFPEIPPIAGVEIATAEAGVRYHGRPDVMLARLVPGTVVAGVFTRSSTRAAPVLDCQKKLSKQSEDGAALLVNSGNANAFTGTNGVTAVSAITNAVADAAGVPEHRVFTASTGVIGEALPHDRITSRMSELVGSLAPGGLEAAARAIMTTDTYPKGAVRQIDAGGRQVTIAGIAKGSGMIAPDMATMLAYVFTDARIEFDTLQRLLSDTNARTFNCITVDSDTSTSDTLIAAATGASNVDVTENEAFAQAFHEVLLDLAHQVVRDGEGASKFVTIHIHGAANKAEAHQIALSIANSPLVKTAIAGEDPNWGRIVMAVGKSGAQADRDKLSISLGNILVAENGWVAPGYSEDVGAAYMKREDIEIAVNVGVGDSSATVWTCDLTKDYIAINADYRS